MLSKGPSRVFSSTIWKHQFFGIQPSLWSSSHMDIMLLKGSQPWIFIGKTDAQAPILWSPDAKNWLTGKDPDAGEDWRQEKGVTEDEMVGWHHPLNGHEFEQTLGYGKGHGSLACCSPWGCKELNWTTVTQKRGSKQEHPKFIVESSGSKRGSHMPEVTQWEKGETGNVIYMACGPPILCWYIWHISWGPSVF